MTTTPIRQCHCGDHYRCEDCRRCVCFCICEDEVDGAPYSQEAVTSGYVNHTQDHFDAWQEKWELTR